MDNKNTPNYKFLDITVSYLIQYVETTIYQPLPQGLGVSDANKQKQAQGTGDENSTAATQRF